MREQSKAANRRLSEKDFNWHKVFKGKCIDIGPGDDGVNIAQWPKLKSVELFDTPQGDCNQIDIYFKPNTFNLVHGSQVAEHTHDPKDFFRRCLKICKKGGYVCMSVPCMELYGDIQWGKDGSRYNGDHKSTWSFGLKRSGAPIHIYVPDFLQYIEKELKAKVIIARVVDTNYNYQLCYTVDQTFKYEDGVEAWIEILIKK